MVFEKNKNTFQLLAFHVAATIFFKGNKNLIAACLDGIRAFHFSCSSQIFRKLRQFAPFLPSFQALYGFAIKITNKLSILKRDHNKATANKRK